MKKFKLLFAALVAGTTLFAQQNAPLWMRYSSISPNGETIAFSYKGDIFTVPSNGGKATQITTNPSYDSQPVWSKDGKQIAFASDRMGSLDVYIVDSEGGTPKRLTTHSANETPIAFLNDSTILYTANIMPGQESIQFPSGQFSQIYSVSTNTDKIARPKMFSSLPMENIAISKDGTTLLFTDKKGYEDQWRKHHTSSITRDIWQCKYNATTNKLESYNKVTNFKGEDRNPVFTPDNKSFYYLSEQDGTFNIWQKELNSATQNQITKFKDNPVRFLTISNNGTLCFTQNGEIYTMQQGSTTPNKINITIITDSNNRDLIKQTISNGASDMAVSADGKQIAFIYHGDVYVTSDEYKTTKQITNTPEQERNIDFAPDGRSIVYSSERNGLWQVYQTSIVNKEEKFFPYCTEIKEERLTNTNKPAFQPLYSPDGKEVAFLEDRQAIVVLNLASKKTRTIMDKKYQYSYSDGDQWYQWSPDSKWILSNSITTGGWNSPDVVLLDASGKKPMHNLTNSGYSDGNAKWVLNGNAFIWESDRSGYRSHGSWGAENDIYIMFLNLEEYEKFRMNKEEFALYEEAQKKEKEEKEKAEKSKKESKKTKNSKKEESKKEEVKPLEFDLDNAEDRVIRLTVNSSKLSDAVLSPKGDKLFYLTRFEGGMDLWVHDIKERSTKILVKNAGYGNLIIDKDGKNIFLGSSNGIKKISVSDGKTTPITFEATFEYKPFKEREYIFNHAWQQVKDKFYDPKIHGINWEGYKETYARFLPHINNKYDFADMLGELLGELNASHTGARYYSSADRFNPAPKVLPIASLGIFVDDNYTKDGIKIKEIIKGSPLDLVKTEIKEGFIIEKIDGTPIKAGEEYFTLLEGKQGKNVLLSVVNPNTNKRFIEKIKPISTSAEQELLYKRWVDKNKEMVEKLSGGKIGYIHIKGMDSPSFRTLYSELLGKNRNKEAVIIDTRHNGGGWLHDDVITLLSGKEYQKFMPRGQYIGSDPFNKWTKPSCMLICEDNYSNAHGTPWLYKTLGVGKLIGTPVPGTMTAVWWETQIDPSIIFGIPQVGCVDNDGDYLENKQLDPDIEVYNKPEDVVMGKDSQIEEAVKSLCK